MRKRLRLNTSPSALPPSTSTPLRDSLSLLFTRRFGTFCFASLLSNIGTAAQQVAQPWLLLSLGAPAFIVGLDSFAQGAPAWLLLLVGGRLADHADRRRVIVGFQSAQALCPVLIVVLLLTGLVRPWMIVGLSLAVGITDALSMPSFQSIVPSIVRREQISTGLALNATQFNLSRILGPAIAGLLMASLGAAGCFAVNAISYVPFLMVAWWVLPRRMPAGLQGHAKPEENLLQSLRVVLAKPMLRSALATAFATSLLCAPLVTFIPVLVRDAFGGDAIHFSIAVAAFGAGGLAGAIALLSVGANASRSRMSSWFGVSYGAMVVLCGLDRWYVALPILLALAGMSMSLSNTSVNTLVQTLAPESLRGQSVSLYMLAVRGGTALGSLATGATASLFGIRTALLVNGSLAVIAQAAIVWQRRRIPPASA
jgi:MFS family permease